MMQQHALTLKGNGISNVLVSEVMVQVPFIGQSESPLSVKVNGIWDTGATNSVINKTIADKLGLKPISMAQVHTASHTINANVYLVNILLPSNVGIQNVRVTEGLIQGADMLIGMDIINIGDFSITNHNGVTVMSFRTPSCCEVDYVREINIANSPGRNDLCTCGSGKKFKRCHGKNV